MDKLMRVVIRKLASIILVLLVIGISPVVSWAGSLEDAQEKVRQNPNNPEAYSNLGFVYGDLGHYEKALVSFKEAIRIKPDDALAHYNLGVSYSNLGHHEKAIVSYKEAIRIKPDYVDAHGNLGFVYSNLGHYEKALVSFKEAIRIKPDDALAHYNLGDTYTTLGRNDEANTEYKEALRLNPNHDFALEEERQKQKARQNMKESDRIAQERRLLEEERKKLEALRLAEENRQQPPEKPSPQSGTGSGFFVSKMGHVITNAHVVKDCNRVTVGDNANKQVPAEVINTDRSNDLALLKLSSLEMASAESKSLIQKLSIVVVPLASKGLLRSEDVRLGEKVLVAGYPYGDVFSNTIKVTSGIVSATRGAGDDSGQFQLDAAVQPGNSGGPIYDSGGNIVGVVISQLDKLKVAKAIGSLPENVNFGIKASTVRQFLISSGLPSKKAVQTDEKSTEQLAEIAQNQALMVMCLQ